MKIKDLAKVDLPREKLQKYGAQKLADHELLALILGSGIKDMNVLKLSEKILKAAAHIGYQKITLKDLLEIKGLGRVKASQVMAILELRNRFSRKKLETISPEDAWKLCADVRESKKEHFVVFYLDAQERVIERQIVSVGLLNTTLVHPREVFEPAVALHAAGIVIAHNHPSGDSRPSQEDKFITTRLIEAGKILGIDVLDHVILSKSDYFSFAKESLM